MTTPNEPKPKTELVVQHIGGMLYFYFLSNDVGRELRQHAQQYGTYHNGEDVHNQHDTLFVHPCFDAQEVGQYYVDKYNGKWSDTSQATARLGSFLSSGNLRVDGATKTFWFDDLLDDDHDDRIDGEEDSDD